MHLSAQEIRSQAGKLKEHNPTLRARDLAEMMCIPEGVLLAAGCGEGIIRLQTDFAAQFAALATLGPVMALTRNSHAVIERVGTYHNFEHFGHASQVIGEEIDLRLFLGRFHIGFAATESSSRGEHRSIQYFDETGTAVHKVHLRAESDAAGWTAFLDRFRAADQSPGQQFAPAKEPFPVRPDSEIDSEGFRAAYQQMRDTHELFGILRTFGIDRLQALRLLGPEFARPVELLALRALLRDAAASALPIMLFVGNQAAIQIYSGPVRTIKQYGNWFNVMDPGFNLHLFEPGILSAWVVHKPTADGLVSSLELYGPQDKSLLLAFSKRKPGQEESSQWRTMLASLPSAGGVA